MAIGSPQWMYASGEAYEIDQSLRFDEDRGTYLSWTPAAAGNRKTFTVSAWVKTSLKSTEGVKLLRAYGGDDDNWTAIGSLDSSGDLWATYNRVGNSNSGRVQVTGKFRDPSSWYHIVIAVDTTQGTAANRVKTYINGEQTSHSYTDYPSQNFDYSFLNNTYEHRIFYKVEVSSNEAGDGYLAEMNFVDGQQLTPADFGETGDYGEWKPIEYSGTYGTNGFYLPFKQDYTVEGFSTVTYAGTSVAGTYIGGVGFQSDLTWVKNRSSSGENHSLYDAVRGGGKTLYPNLTAAENSSNLLTFTTDGFTQNTTNNVASGNNYVAWNWDMGGSNATNTDGSITSTVRANPTYGQSIVSYTGNATAGATVGHGLSSTPELVITKLRSTTGHWLVNHSSFNGDEYLVLSLNEAKGDTGTEYWNGTMPNSTVFTLGAGATNNANSETHIAYCFHSVTGYSKIGSYSGTGSSGNAITTGFKPAFVMIKCTTNAAEWIIVDSTRNPTNPVDKQLFPDVSDAEATSSSIQFDSNGFTLLAGYGNINNASRSYIYMAFADKREYAYWLDQSGNNNDWTSNNLTESDISVDSPTNNFATLNPIDTNTSGQMAVSEGNLKVTHPASGAWDNVKGTFGVSSGKWYWEVNFVSGLMTDIMTGICDTSASNRNGQAWVTGSLLWYNHIGGELRVNGTDTSANYGLLTDGDILGIALNMDDKQITFYKNNTALVTNYSIDSNITTATAYTLQDYDAIQVFNFGQDSSFAGNKTAQGNQDGNSIGDFYYTPPTGFLALCTKNLPDVAVVPSEHFNTVLYTGTGSSQSVDIGFQTDFVWNRKRNDATNFYLQDVVRGFGASKSLSSNTASQEGYDGNPSSQSLSVGSSAITVNGSDLNENNLNFVSWNWKANGSGSSNTDGSITSTVSANTDAGFSIVKWAGDGNSTATIGHGLSKAPELIIEKGLNIANNWGVAQFNDNNYKALILNSTSAWDTGNTYWNSTSPTSTVFSVDNTGGEMNYSGKDYITYCFYSVDGYSKVGSYTGNGNADGTFVYLGFRPAFVMLKKTGNAANGSGWVINDSKRLGYNNDNPRLRANSSGQEDDTGRVELLSNGFKMRVNYAESNEDGINFIYLAFAETPFKYSNAR
jgi:hypothetical protein